MDDFSNSLLRFIHQRAASLRRRLEGQCSLVVAGEFKSGKSTLINALLGDAIVTTDVLPETVTMHCLQYGPQLEITAHLEDGGGVRLERQQLKREALEQVLKRVTSQVKYLSITAPCDILRGLVVVDTPGLGDVFRQYDPQVAAYLQECDVLIYVISALAPLSASEQNFLRLAVLPQDFPKIVFAVNKMDTMRTEDNATRLLAAVRTKLERLFPHATVFPVSALDAMCLLQSHPRPHQARATLLREQFQQFRRHIEETILLNRNLIMLDRACHLFEGPPSLQQPQQRRLPGTQLPPLAHWRGWGRAPGGARGYRRVVENV